MTAILRPILSSPTATIRLTPNYPYPEPRPGPPSTSNYLITNQSSSESDTGPQVRKVRGSAQLNRWSRARALRSGVKSDRQTLRGVDRRSPDRASQEPSSKGSDGDNDEETEPSNSIFMVSDGTGWTVEESVTAALGQFTHCLVDRVCPVNTHLFSGVDDIGRLMEILKQAAKEGAMVVYTLADPLMAESAKKACKLWGVQSFDVLGPLTEAVASHLGVSPSGASGSNLPLSDEYFRRIEAIEFTIKQDDGALPQNLKKADIVLTGVSRTGKTPLSIYLAQKGYKVANVPIVMGIELPKTLFEVDPEKVFGLTINSVVLQAIRKARAKTLGFSEGMRSSYSEMDSIREELEFAGKIFAQNPTWPVIEVTGKAIEETAAVILRLYYDRKHKYSITRISKRY